MPTLVHLSDIHFGQHHAAQLDAVVLRELAALNPDGVIVSGDLTMRARHAEFAQARAFLAQITQPLLTIPGNHDQPIRSPRDWLERLTHQYARYEKYVCAPIDATLTGAGFFALGLNDNHPLAPGGFWSHAQRAWVAQQLDHAPRAALKIIATHHQLAWEGKARPAGFWFPARTLALLARHGVELVLNGHTHVPGALQTPHGIVIVRAGTALSGRTRHGNGNAYNVITYDEKQISVFVRRYDAHADAFVAARAFTFPRRQAKD